MMKRENKGSSFDDWLEEEHIFEEVNVNTLKRVQARQLTKPVKEECLPTTARVPKGELR